MAHKDQRPHLLYHSSLWKYSTIFVPFSVSPQLVLWATSSLSLAPLPALCVRPTAEPARRDRVCANVAVAFIVQPTMPTLPPAQVSLVCLFVYAQLSWRCARAPPWSNTVEIIKLQLPNPSCFMDCIYKRQTWEVLKSCSRLRNASPSSYFMTLFPLLLYRNKWLCQHETFLVS